LLESPLEIKSLFLVFLGGMRLILLLVALALVSGCVQQQGQGLSGLRQEFVARVVDGDTLEMGSGEKVRLIGLDAPELGQPCALEAKLRLEELVLGKGVFLEKDVSDRDKYGRLVRYVYLDGVFVNLVLVEEGLAFAFPFEPDVAFEDVFWIAEQGAADGNGCLWE
jgi:micrococcal nuclease